MQLCNVSLLLSYFSLQLFQLLNIILYHVLVLRYSYQKVFILLIQFGDQFTFYVIVFCLWVATVDFGMRKRRFFYFLLSVMFAWISLWLVFCLWLLFNIIIRASICGWFVIATIVTKISPIILSWPLNNNILLRRCSFWQNSLIPIGKVILISFMFIHFIFYFYCFFLFCLLIRT